MEITLSKAYIVIQSKLDTLHATSPASIYFKSRWNRFDVVTYACIVSCIAVRIANVVVHMDSQYQDVNKGYEIDKLMRTDSGKINKEYCTK